VKFNNIPTWEQWKNASSSTFQIRSSKPLLVRIDNLIKKYHQVFDASKLNILMELKDAIADWEDDKSKRDVRTGRMEAMEALMEVVLRKLYELDGWGKHTYIKACCIGYHLGTGAYDENRVPAGPDPRRTRQREETLEIGSRVTSMIKAIIDAFSLYQTYKAAETIPDDEDRKILKIFMAPEFYFRGPYGAYQDIGWNAKIMSMMRTETSKLAYKDWLFVLGTALFSTDKEEKQGNAMVKVGSLLENYALVQKGGPKTAEHHDLIVAKEFPSHVDFKHPGLGNLEWYDPSQSEAKVGGQMQKHFVPEGARIDPNPAQGALDANTQSVSELVGGTVFTMDGITFGLEVCRDHLIGRLKHSDESGKVLIQLVPSCGAYIKPESVSCVTGGIVFNVDGDGTGATRVLVNGGGIPLQPAQHSALNHLFDPVVIPWQNRGRTRLGALGLTAEQRRPPKSA